MSRAKHIERFACFCDPVLESAHHPSIDDLWLRLRFLRSAGACRLDDIAYNVVEPLQLLMRAFGALGSPVRILRLLSSTEDVEPHHVSTVIIDRLVKREQRSF